jgi:hypothetical protein
MRTNLTLALEEDNEPSSRLGKEMKTKTRERDEYSLFVTSEIDPI